jgi:hypothetical protein
MSVWTQNIQCNACTSALDTLPISFVQTHLTVCIVTQCLTEALSGTPTHFWCKDCYWHKQLLVHFHFWMRLSNDWCLRVKCMCPPLHVYDHLMEEFTHTCHMHSNMYSISCINTFLAQKIFAMIEGVTFLVNLKHYRAAFNCSWIVTSLNLLPISAFFSLWIREMLHGKFWTTYMFVTRNSSTDREDWAGQLPWQIHLPTGHHFMEHFHHASSSRCHRTSE